MQLTRPEVQTIRRCDLNRFDAQGLTKAAVTSANWISKPRLLAEGFVPGVDLQADLYLLHYVANLGKTDAEAIKEDAIGIVAKDGTPCLADPFLSKLLDRKEYAYSLRHFVMLIRTKADAESGSYETNLWTLLSPKFAYGLTAHPKSNELVGIVVHDEITFENSPHLFRKARAMIRTEKFKPKQSVIFQISAAEDTPLKFEWFDVMVKDGDKSEEKVEDKPKAKRVRKTPDAGPKVGDIIDMGGPAKVIAIGTSSEAKEEKPKKKRKQVKKAGDFPHPPTGGKTPRATLTSDVSADLPKPDADGVFDLSPDPPATATDASEPKPKKKRAPRKPKGDAAAIVSAEDVEKAKQEKRIMASLKRSASVRAAKIAALKSDEEIDKFYDNEVKNLNRKLAKERAKIAKALVEKAEKELPLKTGGGKDDAHELHVVLDQVNVAMYPLLSLEDPTSAAAKEAFLKLYFENQCARTEYTRTKLHHDKQGHEIYFKPQLYEDTLHHVLDMYRVKFCPSFADFTDCLITLRKTRPDIWSPTDSEPLKLRRRVEPISISTSSTTMLANLGGRSVPISVPALHRANAATTYPSLAEMQATSLTREFTTPVPAVLDVRESSLVFRDGGAAFEHRLDLGESETAEMTEAESELNSGPLPELRRTDTVLLP